MIWFDVQGQEISIKKIRPELEKAAAAGDNEATQLLNEINAMASNRSMREKLSIEFGRVLPWQWLTNHFMHANWEQMKFYDNC